MDQDLIMSMFSDTEESRKRRKLVKGPRPSSKEASIFGPSIVPLEEKNKDLPSREDAAVPTSLPGISKGRTRSEGCTVDKLGTSVDDPPPLGWFLRRAKRGSPPPRCPRYRVAASFAILRRR